MISRRSFFSQLGGLGVGAAAGVPAAPAPARGLACVTVHCPQCGWQALAPPIWDDRGELVPWRDRTAEVWVDCACGQRYRARFWVET